MKYGDYQLRNDAAYYNSQNVVLYPATNVADAGSLHTEDNVRSIVRRITKKSYKLSKFDFRVSLESDNTIKVAPGEANIQGYHLITNTSLSIKLPNSAEPTAWSLGISLSYDGSNHVTGDVVNSSKPIGENETFSGAYLFFFDSCQISHNYDNILVLARVWEHNGKIIQNESIPWYNDNGEIDESTPRYISNGIENDSVNDNILTADKIELTINGAQRTAFDAIQTNTVENIKDISNYDTMKYPVELDLSKYTKPQSFTTDLQDYLNYMPDWYTSKFGDYMTGALRFDNLSIDAKIKLDPDNAIEYIKDSSGNTANKSGKYHNTEGVIISPRTIGNLTGDKIDYTKGGTVMSVIPRSYSQGIDNGTGAGYSALIAQTEGDIGLSLHHPSNNTSRISMPYSHADGYMNGDLLIENKTWASVLSSSLYHRGNIFTDSYNGGLFQWMSAKSSDSYPLAFQIGTYSASMLLSDSNNHRKLQTKSSQIGLKTSNNLIEVGDRIGYDTGAPSINTEYIKNPYISVGNVTLYSNSTIASSYSIPGLRLTHMPQRYNSNKDYESPYYKSSGMPSYVKILPGAYMHNAVIEDYMRIGVTNNKEVLSTAAFGQIGSYVMIGKSGISSYDSLTNQPSAGYAYIEQTQTDESGTPTVLNKMQPKTAIESRENQYQEIGGILSTGNIGCSNQEMGRGSGRKASGIVPYNKDSEWVRFTQYRYDKDNDKSVAGTNTGGHSKEIGKPYNIEFNTTVANQRSNQIIWNYMSDYSGNSDHQPVTLSYIHDTATNYPNDTYYDYNLYQHRNPTYAVRDILRIDGAGLSVHGDINNPELDNGNQTLGVTIAQGRVYSATYNDYAETYIKDDINEEAVEGMLVMLNPKTGKYRINKGFANNLVVGVISDNYGMLIGGKTVESVESQVESMDQRYNFAVGVAGKLFVNVDKENIKPGDLLISSKIDGLATCDAENTRFGNIVGKALSNAEKVEGKDYYRCLMQIMLS